MANRSRQLSTSKGVIKYIAKKPEKQAQWGSWLSSTLAIALLLSSAGLFIAFAWISILFIFNPEQVSWMNKFLPSWAQIPVIKGEPAQTLTEIQLRLGQQNQIAGEILPLDNPNEKSFLLPVWQQRANCQSDCREIVELRVYQPTTDLELQSQPETHYHLVTKLDVTGPDESFVESPLVDGTPESANQEVKTPLPLTAIKRFGGSSPSPGMWFYLQGQRQQGRSAIAYGHIIYYNPQNPNLQQMLSWTSPSGQPPKWQQVTGSNAPELVIDQTVGLEPHLRIYQVKSVNKWMQLEAVSLQSPAIPDTAYKDALFLARSGLWTPAYEWLKFIQRQQKNPLPTAAQAQIDFIRLHSQLTQTQAEKNWANPGQEVLAELLDGRWAEALQVFEASPQNIPEITTLLKANGGRLWTRAAAALRVNPTRPDVQAWGTLIIAVRQGDKAAKSWLQSQPKITPETLAYIQSLLAKLNGEVTTASILATHPSQIVGSVQQVTQINQAEWLQANSTADLKLSANQVWYQVKVAIFNDGQNWLNFPFRNLKLPKSTPGKFLWETLGIISDPKIQIVIWSADGEQQTTTATIKAVQLQGGALSLLAAGNRISPQQSNSQQPKPLALTDTALEWVQPSPMTIQELYSQNPPEAQAMLSIVWRTLQQSGEIPAGGLPSFLQLQELLGDWPVQAIDLTNNGKPQVVMTISAAAIASLNQQLPGTPATQKTQIRPRTLILSASGQVIYTDFTKNGQQALTAITKLGEEQSLALLVETANGYSLRRWSQTNQRFE
jgi:hypothetical protein